ncbi:hypothetical protein SCL_1387 [Sulfuricaulis limicola]|uniref:DUF3014 domain-containing protein n=2 Tax=Sulfuricaulis limicola TaxID=1620215 RepID=A0A1B4XFW4_9GAMM|nr:hypothetical protein SCL_1387 [Sulfuricaulis limicola]
MWLMVLLVLGGIAAGFYYWQMQPEPGPAPAPPPAEAPPEAKPEPQIRHPIKEMEPSEKPLPTLESSDDAMLDVLTGFFGQQAVQEFFDVREIVRRFVVTVDNLPRKHVALRYRLFKPVAGQFLATGEGDNYLTNTDNFRRYKSYVLLSDAVDARKLVAVYTRFYPLFQQEYVNLGYPKGYFNDRLVEAIDDLLAAPEIPSAIKLVRPKVMYLFADPALEELSAGQKIMIRMGVENAVRIKARLREVRQELTGQALQP